MLAHPLLKEHTNRAYEPKPRDWTPRRNGVYYCSPACGGGTFCLRSDFEQKTKLAAALVAELGHGWTARVHENLGWHYCAEKGVASMSEYIDGWTRSYTLFFNTTPQILGQGSTPENAIDDAFRVMHERIDNMRRDAAKLIA